VSAAEGSGWLAIGLDDIEAVPWRGSELVWRPVRNQLGTFIVGMSGYTADRAGQVVVEGHTESEHGLNHEEVYVVLRGRATFTLDGTELDAPAGTFVAVLDPGVHRGAVAAEPGTAVLALGALPAFVPSDSEWIERARPHLRSDPARAIAILEDLRAVKPDGPVAEVAAAFIAIARGDESAARAALAKLIARRPDLVAVLADDEDLEPLLG
jgi:mannose-6-phosphate isomerase-like protein (cupin superfamily)